MADIRRDAAPDEARDRARGDRGRSGTPRGSDWSTEERYWREHYASRPYAAADRGFEHYRDAYRFGAESASRHGTRRWEDAERDLELAWREDHSGSMWGDVKAAVRDAWDHVRGRDNHARTGEA